MALEPGKQIIAIHILHNISRSNDNRAMKFDQLTEYDMTFFFKNHTQNVVEKLVPDT